MQTDLPAAAVRQPTFPGRLLLALAGLWCLAAAVVVAALVLPERATMMAAAARDQARFLAMLAVSATAATGAVWWFRQRIAAWVLAGAAVSVLGTALEVQESLTGGYFSWTDLGTNLVAAFCGLAVVQAVLAPRHRARWLAAASIGMGLSAIVFADMVLLYAQRDAQAPVLIDAQAARQARWVRPATPPVRRIAVPPQWARFDGEWAFAVPLDQGEQPGFALDEPLQNWDGWSGIAIEVINPGDAPLRLILNIDDMRGSGRPGDRYDEWVTVPAGRRVVLRTSFATISRALPHRRFAFEDMDIVYLYAVRPVPGAGLFVTRAWLE